MGPIKCPKQYCGDVFITNNYLMMLECKFCTKEFVPYDEFLKHIFDIHFDNIEVYESDTEDDNGDEMGIINAQESDGESPGPNSTVHFECEKTEQSTGISTSNTKYQEESRAVAAYNKQKRAILRTKTTAVSTNVRAVSKKNFAIQKTGGVRKYKCKFCENLFDTRYRLHKHEIRHTGNKSHCCTKCDKKFYTNNELNLHMRWHTGERPFICPYCGSGFVSSGALGTHEKFHLNDRKYKCDQCDKSYLTSDMLKAHRTVHTGERNYKCKVCSNTFTRSGSLRNHMKLHENALRYECNLCSKRFNQKPGLIWHTKRYHDIVFDESAAMAGNLLLESNKTPSNHGKDIACEPGQQNCVDNQLAFHVYEEGESETILDFI